MPDRTRKSRDARDDYVERPLDSRRRKDHYDDNHARGLNRDYYDGHPLAPQPRQSRRDHYDDDHHRRQSSRADQAIGALMEGNLRGALQAVKPRSKSVAAAPRSSQHLRSHSRSGGSHSHSHSQSHSHSHSHSRDHHHGRHRGRSPPPDDRHLRPRTGARGRANTRSRSRSRSDAQPRRRGVSEKRWEHAAGAAFTAAAVEALRVRKEPGGWSNGKMTRVATAAIGAATIDARRGRDPDRHPKRHVAEATLGGLLVNRLANGRDRPR